jgi:hypothetical protein
MATLDAATKLLIAQRDALKRPVERLLRCQEIPEQEIPTYLAHGYLALAVEAWREAYPMVDEGGAAQLFGEMATAAMQAFSDARVLLAARRNLGKGEINHA